MRILCLLAEDPFPPKNGVTIPMYNHILLFKSLGFDVDYLNMITSSVSKSVKTSKFLREIFFIEPFFTVDLSNDSLTNLISSKSGGYDIIYYSPISMWKIANFAKVLNYKIHNKDAKIIASISDCYTSVLKTYLSSHSKISLLNISKFLRGFYMGIHEKKILNYADLVLVQTKKDKDWLEKINFKGNTLVVTNGVNNSLFDLEFNFTKEIVYVANINSEFYKNKLKWFVKIVWPKVNKLHPDAVLHIYLGNYKNKLFEDEELINIILHTTFVDELQDIYINKTISIAPIFKNYGFINKVAEAMASGLIVIGDSSAFNGIKATDSFLIAETDEDFVNCIDKVLSDKDYSQALSFNAKKFAIENFSWEKRTIDLTSLLKQWEFEV